MLPLVPAIHTTQKPADALPSASVRPRIARAQRLTKAQLPKTEDPNLARTAGVLAGTGVALVSAALGATRKKRRTQSDSAAHEDEQNR